MATTNEATRNGADRGKLFAILDAIEAQGVAASLTTSLVHAAAVRGVCLTEVESAVDGDLDAEGVELIRISFRIDGDGSPETLREVAERASVPVELEMETP